MIGQTNSLIGNFDPTLSVFAAKPDSRTFSSGDKTFIRKTDFLADAVYTGSVTSVETDANSYIEPYYLNDSEVLSVAAVSDSSIAYVYDGVQWNEGSLQLSVDILSNAVYRQLLRGQCLVIGGKHLHISDNRIVTDLSDDTAYYAGKFFDNDYAVSSTDGSILLYDWATKEAGETVLSREISYLAHGADEDNNLLFVEDTSGVFYLFRFNDDDTITQRGFSSIPGTVTAYTGLASGDYIFITESTALNYNNHFIGYDGNSPVAGTGNCQVHIYISAGNGLMTPIDDTSPLYPFLGMSKVLMHYDKRSQMLFVGTTDKVYLYYFDKTAKCFTEVFVSSLVLPENQDAYIYNGAVSPHLKHLIVYCGNPIDSGRNVKIYDLAVPTDTGWEVVDVKDDLIEAPEVWSAVATGVTNTVGDAQFKLLLPQAVELSVDVTPTPDSFNF